MKYEPLKGKVIDGTEIPDESLEYFKIEDVKSAVQGLIRELESRIKELDRYEEMGFTKQFCANRRDEIKTYIIPLIKKWFADVINKEGEE